MGDAGYIRSLAQSHFDDKNRQPNLALAGWDIYTDDSVDTGWFFLDQARRSMFMGSQTIKLLMGGQPDHIEKRFRDMFGMSTGVKRLSDREIIQAMKHLATGTVIQSTDEIARLENEANDCLRAAASLNAGGNSSRYGEVHALRFARLNDDFKKLNERIEKLRGLIQTTGDVIIFGKA